MRIVLCCLFCLPVTVRGDVVKPKGLTPKEIAEGWILLFDGRSTFGWNVLKGDWKITEKGLVAPKSGTGILQSTSAFGESTLKVEYSVDKGGEGSIHGNALTSKEKKTEFEKKGKTSPIMVFGKNLTIHSLKLKPQKMESIFNGKDLTGWKIHPGRRSKFTVTKEGHLHVKDGNGDLQTKKQWSDFILQLECKVNGDNLNSGIFFRCLPDLYQQGYEAQIHNGFTDTAQKTYTLSSYDPKTHKLKEKQTVKSKAKDYGTGAIYRRIPARFQAAKDGEWFTMTVLARGRHIATWVNGIQVVDWTDHRPLDENPRKGCRLKAGAISIQGHDPTTDLSFRAFRVAELPKSK